MLYQRTLSPIIEKITQHFPILLLTGPRQVGKTTLLEACAKGQYNYVSLDSMEARVLAQNDPGLFIQTYQTPLIIDEVQYAPQLFSYLKIVVDREKKPGLFWLTGSQKFHLMNHITESLAGRVAIIDLLGLSNAELQDYSFATKPFLPTNEWIEYVRHQNRTPQPLLNVFETMWYGSFPKVQVRDPIIRDVFYQSYIQTYIQRDIKDILDISDDSTFYKFLGALAARTGQLLNYADLARDVEIDNKTVKSWLSILETSGLIYLLQPYHSNLTKRLIKTPKLYFLDTGLCTYLTKWPDSLSLERSAMSGAILETYIFGEILKSYYHNGKTPHLYFYRDFDQKEIDLLIDVGDMLYPVEFKKTATPINTAHKHFHILEKLGKKIGPGAVICFVERDVPLSREVTAIPVGYL